MNSQNYVSVRSLQFQGLLEQEIRIEALKSKGLPQLSLLSLPNNCLKESRDKIKTLVSQIIPWGPMDRILVQLSPPDQDKIGIHLEVPIAIATLICLAGESWTQEKKESLQKNLFAGSLNLNADLESCDITRNCQNRPDQNFLGAPQFQNLKELWDFLNSSDSIPKLEKVTLEKIPTIQKSFSRVSIKVEGRKWERFWLCVAATAQLPAILMGPPGVGKSHLAKWSECLIPKPIGPAKDQIEQIWKLSGQKIHDGAPVLNPHSRSQLSEFVGFKRQNMERPGYFSLAHGGLLILDEFAEMNRDVREILRTVLDQKKIIRNSSSSTVEWPADFWLILTSNPCPCGYSEGLVLNKCRCSTSIRLNYQSRLSGPVLDRMGIKLWIGLKETWRNTSSLNTLLDDDTVLSEKIEKARIQSEKLQAIARKFLIQQRINQSPRELFKNEKLLAAASALCQKGFEEVWPLFTELYSQEKSLLARP